MTKSQQSRLEQLQKRKSLREQKKKRKSTVQEDITLETIYLTEGKMSGQVRSYLLDVIRAQPKPWAKMSESEQTSVASSVDCFAQTIVRQMVNMMSSDGRKVIRANLDQVTVKDGIKATLTCRKDDENRHELIDAQGASVLIVVADAEKYIGGENIRSEVTPEQSALPLDEVAEDEPPASEYKLVDTSTGLPINPDEDEPEEPASGEDDDDASVGVTKAWNDGGAAFTAGLNRAECPYDADSAQAKAWLAGWAEQAKAEPEDAPQEKTPEAAE